MNISEGVKCISMDVENNDFVYSINRNTRVYARKRSKVLSMKEKVNE